VRVIGGELGGRRLTPPPAGTRDVRPTSERAREAIFSVLGEAVEGATVLDLFCGTGALAIEALSRGAARAVLVDRAPALAVRNIRDLGLDDRAEVVRADALDYLRRSPERFALAFCDPPYTLADRLEVELDLLVPKHLEQGARLILESGAKRPLRLTLPLLRERVYGDAHLAVYGAGEA
jgi:16S rRNA (guanine(966)-N(2))-methyltransferase RsmD